MLQFWIVVSVALSVCHGLEPSKRMWNDTLTDRLKRDLLLTYDRFARPNDMLNVTDVEVQMTITHIDIDEDKSILNVMGWLKMEWNDNKLKWNKSDYGGLDILHVAVHEIWVPDIFLYNSATGTSQFQFSNSNCLVYSNGTVLWVPPTHSETFCDLNLRLWPFDKHNCHVILGSWTFNANQINITKPNDPISQEILVKSHQWNIVDVGATRNVRLYACCEEPYVDIDFNITLERRSPMFKSVVLTPAIIVILLTLSSFWLPAQSGEKILLNGVIALIIVAFLLYFAQKLPVMAVHTPLVVLFYSSSLYLVSFSMILSVLVINMSRTRQAQAVPWFVKSFLDGFMGTALGLKTISIQPQSVQRAEELRDQPFDEHLTSEDHQIIQKNHNSGPIQQSWILLATAIDRIAFILYSIIFIILAICYSI